MVSRSSGSAFVVCFSRAGPCPFSLSYEIDVIYQIGLSCLISSATASAVCLQQWAAGFIFYILNRIKSPPA